MKNIFLSIAVVILSCNTPNKSNALGTDSLGSNNTQQQTDTALKTQTAKVDTAIQGSWQMQTPQGTTGAINSTPPTLNFNFSDSTVTGTTGCNNLRTTFTLQGGNLTFGEQMIVTKKACPGYNENAFLENLTQTNRYRISNGILELLNNDVVLSQWAKNSLAKDTTNRL